MAATDDQLIKHHDYSVQLASFEGPLDLLLFLIRRNEIDIYDIPIETVLKQYLGVLRNLEQQQPEVAGEFFVMAATLMQIKSRMLLPRDQRPVETDDGHNDDATLDPRWELVQQLLAYRKFKDAAKNLEHLIEAASHTIPRVVTDLAADRPQRPLRSSDRIEVWNTFNLVLRRLAERITVGEIEDEVVTVAECMQVILQRLNRGEVQFRFSELFPESRPRSQSHLIATFLAVLELTRLKKLTIEQEDNFSDIVCYHRPPDDPDSPTTDSPSPEMVEPEVDEINPL